MRSSHPRPAVTVGTLLVLALVACQTATSGTPAPTSSPTAAPPTPSVTAAPSPTPAPTVEPTQPVASTPAAGETPSEVPLTVELQFCSLEQGRDDVLALLDQLDAAVASSDWEAAKVPAGELANWSFGWRAYIDEPVKSFLPTVAVAAALAAALDLLDLQITDIQGFSAVAGRPPPSAEAITAATTGLRAAIDLIGTAITAVPELACGVGIS